MLRDRKAVWDALNAMTVQTELDDTHDMNGYTLYTLQFNVTVRPDERDQPAVGLVRLTMDKDCLTADLLEKTADKQVIEGIRREMREKGIQAFDEDLKQRKDNPQLAEQGVANTKASHRSRSDSLEPKRQDIQLRQQMVDRTKKVVSQVYRQWTRSLIEQVRLESLCLQRQYLQGLLRDTDLVQVGDVQRTMDHYEKALEAGRQAPRQVAAASSWCTEGYFQDIQ